MVESGSQAAQGQDLAVGQGLMSTSGLDDVPTKQPKM